MELARWPCHRHRWRQILQTTITYIIIIKLTQLVPFVHFNETYLCKLYPYWTQNSMIICTSNPYLKNSLSRMEELSPKIQGQRHFVLWQTGSMLESATSYGERFRIVNCICCLFPIEICWHPCWLLAVYFLRVGWFERRIGRE